ncbi:Zinc finger PHD-type [Penicillium verhagenii]|nr:Zinc finger PHD-type [Penicillium verhagenii]
MPMTDETDHSGGVILDGPFDPDAQATVTDYIDYTEYLPADLIRSLTLIQGLDERYLDSAQEVHSLSRTYGQLPDLPPDERPNAISLRRQVSHQLDRAINARESAYAEACRLYDVVDRHFDRLSCIRQKLEALPRPPSKSGASTTRITLRLDGRKKSGTQKSRRRVGLGGQFADFNPDSPIASTEQSDADAETLIVPKSRPPKKEKQRRPSSGVVVSTSHALASLKPPPPDAKPGSEHAPWGRLTEYEMTKLRKKMKKNAMWQPSEVMIHRELALMGRGWDNYVNAKQVAEESGIALLDCDNLAETYRGEKPKDMEDTKISNRGMKLNEAKKLKRELLAREAAANGGELVLTIKQPVAAQGTPASRPSRKRKREETTAEDDLLTSAIEALSANEPVLVPLSKSRRKSDRGGPSSGLGSTEATNAPALPEIKSQAPAEAKVSPPLPSPSGSRRSAGAKSVGKPVATPTPPVTRPSSRRSAAAALSEPRGLAVAFPVAVSGGRDLRVKSATPARKTPVRETSHAPSVPAPARRRKRPAPGPVSSGQDGGAAVSYGRRKAKPSKKRLLIPNSQDVRVDEDGVLEEINANEPRYCLCGDVSFGTMICCENQDCDREWFHLDCIGLTEVPSRTAKWYCPECRVKFSKGSDGIVKGGSRR